MGTSKAAGPTMHILDAIRTLRKEKRMGFDEAKEIAVNHFRLKGYPIPESIDRMVPKPAAPPVAERNSHDRT